MEDGGTFTERFDAEIDEIYQERVSGVTGNINQAFVDLYELITEDSHFKRYKELQLIPYGSAINGLLDSDKDQGDLDMTLVLIPKFLTQEEIDPTFIFEKIKTLMSSCRYELGRQYPGEV